MWHFEAKYFNWMAEENKTIHIEVNDYGQEVSELDMWILAVEKSRHLRNRDLEFGQRTIYRMLNIAALPDREGGNCWPLVESVKP